MGRTQFRNSFKMKQIKRCHWCGTDPISINYHDHEWGVPVHDERQLFEFLVLEGMQAGLSWITILRKRERLREVFLNFDPKKLAHFTEKDVTRLMQDPGIIRHAAKIQAVINNAKSYLALSGSLNDFLWQFTDGQVIQNRWLEAAEVPTSTPAAKAMARELKKKGFNFVGEKICYALMQAVGMVNDHVVTCFKHKMLQIKKLD